MRSWSGAMLCGLGLAAAWGVLHGDHPTIGREQRTSPRARRPVRQDRPPMPAITRPVLFNTPEADAILAALQVFPAGQPLERGHLEQTASSQLAAADRLGRGEQRAWPITWTWRSSWCHRPSSASRSRSSTAIPTSRTPGRFPSPTTRRSRTGRSMARQLDRDPAQGYGRPAHAGRRSDPSDALRVLPGAQDGLRAGPPHSRRSST